jgi:predicted nuclease with TOPRIM domain
MKIGTFVFLLMIILISFGYVISDDQQARRRLDETLAENENLKLYVAQAGQELNSCQKTVQNDQQIISEQENKITLLSNTIFDKDSEIGYLKDENSRQASRISSLEKDLVNLSGNKNKLQDIQTANVGLQLDPIVWAVILIVQLVLFVVQRRQKNGYVRLSGKERALIISLRRKKKM